MSKILYVDAHAPSHELLRNTFPYLTIYSAYSISEGLTTIGSIKPDLILTEIDFPGEKGFSLLEQLVQHSPRRPVVVLSTLDSTPNVVRALHIGAEHFFSKPFVPGQLCRHVHELLALMYPLQQQIPKEENGNDISSPLDALTGCSEALFQLKHSLRLFAAADAPVLITGESGSGKELVAQTLHKLSPRCNGPYKTVHCGAIPMSLLEAELYGCEPGAFTGSIRRPGHFEQAHQGSLFLDEIAEMSPAGQMKLLRIIEAQQVTRIGGRRPIPISVRIICATNRDITELVSQGSFRADLYFRIHTLPINLPPLRARKEDIAPLSLQFLRQQQSCLENPISYSALIKLTQYDWPGNVRELRNTLQLAMVLSRGEVIQAEHIRVAY
ncbi:MAG: sigma-54 dependent transcriptional regulator [Spirochaetia bacterium]|nr:sigma-54 dependent transcriptional regulator [Spirochaetia bacterium]